MSSDSAAVARASLAATPEEAEAMAGKKARSEAADVQPVKKARVEEPKSYGDVDVETKSEKYMIPLFDNEVVYIVLTPSGPAKIAYGFDMRGQYEQRSFNNPGTKAAGSESLAIQIELDNEQSSSLRRWRLSSSPFSLRKKIINGRRSCARQSTMRWRPR